jgi:hypothetical protein
LELERRLDLTLNRASPCTTTIKQEPLQVENYK